MSNERNDSDRLVSDAYHELADEKTPETLNREVLRLAAKEGRTRYSIARGWMRPAAWAATIGLSLVVVLELTNMPEPEMAPLPQSVPMDSAAAPEASDRRRESTGDEAMLKPEAREERQDALAKRSRPYSPEEQVAEKAMMLNDAQVVVTDAAKDEDASQTRDGPRSPEADDLYKMQETMERARQQTDQPALVQMDVEQTPEPVAEKSADSVAASRAETELKQSAAAAPRAESFAAGVTSLRADEDYLCPAEARESADRWLKCIRELEASSPRELVDREYEEFRKRFPKFEHPAADR